MSMVANFQVSLVDDDDAADDDDKYLERWLRRFDNLMEVLGIYLFLL